MRPLGVCGMRLGVSSYSYWHFQGAPYPLEAVLDEAARLGMAGVEVLERQLGPDPEPARLHRLRRQALCLGLDLYAVSTHQDFVSPDPEVRAAEVERTRRSLELAARLGAGCIRVNSGRWKTAASFDALMAAGGEEAALPGHTEDEAFAWVTQALLRLAPVASACGVVLGLENHWGLTATAEGVVRILDALPAECTGAVLDTGNFRPRDGDPYAQMALLAPRAVLVHAKDYTGGGLWYTTAIDQRRVARLLADAGYRGYVSLEFEGRAPAASAVPDVLERLRGAMGG